MRLLGLSRGAAETVLWPLLIFFRLRVRMGAIGPLRIGFRDSHLLFRKCVRLRLHKFAGAVLIAVGAHSALSDSASPAIGRNVTPEELLRIDIDVMPDGRGLPQGQGRVSSGAEIYAQKCEVCHGIERHGGSNGSLAGEAFHSAAAFATDRSLKKTVGNYWPYATTLFDYVRRAMPYDAPGSLTDSEVYDLTAYILHLNGLIEASAILDRESLPRITMPARRYFKATGPRETTR